MATPTLYRNDRSNLAGGPLVFHTGMMATATVARVTPDIAITEIKSAWRAYQQTEKYGLEFGRICCEWRERFKVQGFKGNAKGQGITPTLEQCSIPVSTAYWWMERYEISIGTKEPKFRAGATFVDDQQTVEWYTPETVIKRVLKVFGKIDLDPCADPSHHIPATIHYTEADDGLTKNWKGRVFVNPPYGEGMARWMHKANEEVKSGTAKEIILLLPARTNAGWFQTFGSVSSSFCFPKGGLRFVKGETMREGDAAMFPSVIVYMGQNRKRFKAAFKDLGMVLVSV